MPLLHRRSAGTNETLRAQDRGFRFDLLNPLLRSTAYFHESSTLSSGIMIEGIRGGASISDDESGDPLDLQDDEGWEDAEPDEEKTTLVSLFDDEQFSDMHSMLEHCKEKHGFDLVSLKNKFGV